MAVYLLLLFATLVMHIIETKAEVICKVNSIHTNFIENGNSILNVVYDEQRTRLLEICCQFKNYSLSKRTSPSAEETDFVNFELYNETYRLLKNNMSGGLFQDSLIIFNITDEDLGSYYESFSFQPPSWKFKINAGTVGVEKNVLSGRITWMSRDVSNIFSSNVSCPDNEEGITWTWFPCNSHVKYIIKDYFENREIKLILKVLDSFIGETTIETNVSVAVTSVAITYDRIFLLLQDVLYVGQYERLFQKIILTKIATTDNKDFSHLYYTPCCFFKFWQLKSLELIMVAKKDRVDGFFYSQYPFEQWNSYEISNTWSTNTSLISIHHDVERRNFLLLLKDTKRRTDGLLQNRSVVHVYRVAGGLFCKPFHFFVDEIYDMQYRHGLFEAVGASANSADGGCHFKLKPNIQPSQFTDALFATRNILKLYRTRQPMDADGNQFNPLFTCFYYGCHSTQRVITNDKVMETYYVHRPIPISDNILTSFNIQLILISESNVYIVFLESSFNWPSSIINESISCFTYQITCKVFEKNNSSHVSVRCIFDATFDREENYIICPAHTWYMGNMYSAKQKCMAMNITSNRTMFFSSDKNTNVLSLEMPLFTDSCKGVIENVSPSNIDVSIMHGVLMSDENKEVCFGVGYESLFDVLFTPDVSCPISLQIYGVNRTLVYLDAWETMRLNIRLIFNPSEMTFPEIFKSSLLHVYATNLDQVTIRTKYHIEKYEQNLTIHVQQKWLYPSITVLNISTNFYHNRCDNISHAIKLVGNCPHDKHMVFYYPFILNHVKLLNTHIEDDDGIFRVYSLPVNYQPPSAKGTGIPMTTNVYNAHPSQKMYKENYFNTQNSYYLKQCREKDDRKGCACSEDQEVSSKMEDSDCINKVYRILYTEKLVPSVYIQRGMEVTVMEYPYYITEQNDRNDFDLTDTVLESSRLAMSFAKGSSIEFKGSGLYHFKLELAYTNVSFCRLSTEFIVYVVNAPLPKPIEDLVRVTTAIVFGFIIIFVFLYQYYY